MFGLGTIKLIGLGLGAGALLALGIYVWDLKRDKEVLLEQKAALEQKVEFAAGIAEQNAKEAARIKAQAETNEDLIRETYEARLKATEKRTRILEEIDNADPEDDAPAAPVLERTVRRLYGPEGIPETYSGGSDREGEDTTNSALVP